jgi:glucose/arabinose dehydrogenase
MIPRSRLAATFVVIATQAVGCAPADDASAVEGSPSPLAIQCAPDNGGITLPPEFCAIVVADSTGAARHIEVADNGDIFVALRDRRTSREGPVEVGGILVLRDSDADGRPDMQARWDVGGGNDLLLTPGAIYFARNDAILRYALDDESLTPQLPADTIVSGLPDTRNHTAKSIALGPDGSLYVNIGSPSNACMQEARTPGSPGMDPCPELDTRAGVWRFDANTTGQTQADGTRFATGLRNTVALAVHPNSGSLYGVVHGRDQLDAMFPDRFSVDDNTEKPSEEFVLLEEGDDYGWPYCYHDPATGQKLLAPEYGGDGSQVGRCADMDMPIFGFPAHWAPNDLTFYTGGHFPQRYHRGAFIAFHGSWNRAPNPQDGYRVVFVSAADGSDWEIFADDFLKDDADQIRRPVGVSVGPDGSLYVSDSRRGTIWRIVYRGS